MAKEPNEWDDDEDRDRNRDRNREWDRGSDADRDPNRERGAGRGDDVDRDDRYRGRDRGRGRGDDRWGDEDDDEVERRARRRRQNDDSDLTAGEWVAAILCSGIACIVGIVWMIQGRPKGTKMFGISLLFVIIWGVIRVSLDKNLRNG